MLPAIPAIPKSALFFGGAVVGGAVIGGAIGAYKSFSEEGVDNQFSRQDGRDAIANAILGAGVGAAAGVSLLAMKKLVPVLPQVPVIGNFAQFGTVGTIGLGIGVGSAGLGAYTLARNAFN